MPIRRGCVANAAKMKKHQTLNQAKCQPYRFLTMYMFSILSVRLVLFHNTGGICS